MKKNVGALMLSSSMNGFYGLKRLTGNLPAEAHSAPDAARIEHPEPGQPSRLLQLGSARGRR